MLKKTIHEVFKSILAQNALDNRDAIPHSNDFQKKMESTYGISEQALKEILYILKEAHKIFIIGIVKEDSDRSVERIDGYIDADLSTVRRLKNAFQKLLSDLYEEEYNKRVLPHQIIREIFPEIYRYNNTPLGHIANKAIMLEEYELLLEKEFSHYTEDWKDRAIDELIAEHSATLQEKLSQKEPAPVEADPVSAVTAQQKGMRAVDTVQADEFAPGVSLKNVEKILQIYGIDFFYRVNLRKYNFDLIKGVIERRIIRRKEDLSRLRSMIQKVKGNADRDPSLNDHMEELFQLERTVSRFMLMRND
ncbi:MAG: hypothetical protein CVV44_04745 [Spirochaetae bacterium HGW-Spirochaetae-1]|jgi:hypothetical protein|nr:MAG: hypothetical protein CVV44_04745 [Spirochaetae bacterium HGW-Spirochaetae-1]